MGNVHEMGGVFDNLPTPDKMGPLRTNLFLRVKYRVSRLSVLDYESTASYYSSYFVLVFKRPPLVLTYKPPAENASTGNFLMEFKTLNQMVKAWSKQYVVHYEGRKWTLSDLLPATPYLDQTNVPQKRECIRDRRTTIVFSSKRTTF